MTDELKLMLDKIAAPDEAEKLLLVEALSLLNTREGKRK